MGTSLKRNTGDLWIYCVSAQVIGWMLMVIPAVVVVTQLAGSGGFESALSGLISKWPLTVQVVFSNSMLPGLVLIGIAKFMRYLLDDEYQPDWLLSHGSTILYACAVVILAGNVGGLLQGRNYMMGIGLSRLSSNWVLSALPTIAIVLILVGAGLALQRIIPVIEDSKTSVKPGTTASSQVQRTR